MNNIYMNNITQIDCAYVDDKGNIVGASYNVDAIVTGELNGEEAVVEDFGTSKKRIKALIDGPGPDHKLVLYNGWSEVSVYHNDSLISLTDLEALSGQTQIRVVCDQDISLPRNALCIVDHTVDVDTCLAGYIDRLTSTGFTKVTSCLNTDVVPLSMKMLDEDVVTSDPHMFRYVHGLQHSTSYGCQNIVHGHLSYVQLFYANVADRDSDDIGARDILNLLDNKYLANANEVQLFEEGTGSALSYTKDRGYFRLECPVDNITLFPYESTIENIATFLCNELRQSLNAQKVVGFAVSEGLTKGSMVML